MTEEDNIYYKQSKLYNPYKDKQPQIYIYGAGSIGSHVTIGLLKTGFENITVYDYDDLEEANMPAQFYPTNLPVEKSTLKTHNLSRIAYIMTGKYITTHNIKIDETFNPDISAGTIHILAFDNIEARKTMKRLLNDFPVHLIDGRIGEWNNEVWHVQMDDLPNRKTYGESLQKEFSELECGEKTLWCNNSYIASKIIMNVIKISKEENNIPLMEKGHMKSTIIIKKEKLLWNQNIK